jgi:hypothetical protein
VHAPSGNVQENAPYQPSRAGWLDRGGSEDEPPTTSTASIPPHPSQLEPAARAGCPGICRASASTLRALHWPERTLQFTVACGDAGGGQDAVYACTARVEESAGPGLLLLTTPTVQLPSAAPRAPADLPPPCATLVLRTPLPQPSAATRARMQAWLGGVVLCEGSLLHGVCGLAEPLGVLRTVPSGGFVQVVPQTKLLLELPAAPEGTEEEELEPGSGAHELARLVERKFTHAAQFAAMGGLELPSGILLVGPPGVGKTRAARLLCRRLLAHTSVLFLAPQPSDVAGSAYVLGPLGRRGG